LIVAGTVPENLGYAAWEADPNDGSSTLVVFVHAYDFEDLTTFFVSAISGRSGSKTGSERSSGLRSRRAGLPCFGGRAKAGGVGAAPESSTSPSPALAIRRSRVRMTIVGIPAEHR
jgi:hypothetical protein